MNGDENNTSNSIVRSKIKGKTVVLVTESKSGNDDTKRTSSKDNKVIGIIRNLMIPTLILQLFVRQAYQKPHKRLSHVRHISIEFRLWSAYGLKPTPVETRYFSSCLKG